MASYDFVSPPSGLSYAAPMIDFGIIGNLPDTYRKAQDQKRQADVADAFKNQPLPLDPATGLPDYGKIMQVLASKGGIDAITKLAPAATEQGLINRAGQMSPLLTGGAAAAPPGPTPTQTAAPQTPDRAVTTSRPPLPNPAAPAAGGYTPMTNAPNSVANIVQSTLPPDKAGPVIVNMAKSLGVQPEAPLSPEQEQALTRRLGAYATRTGISPAPAAAPGAPVAAPGGGATGTATPEQLADARRRLAAGAAPAGDSVADRFGGLGAPLAMAQATPADAAAAPAGPAQAPQAPLVPQVPLPKGFTDPQQAILALSNEAARFAVNPYAKGQVSALNDWATRIENSLTPLKIGQSDTVVDPKTGQTIFQGPMAKAISAGGTLSGPALQGAAERYFQTGQFPSGMTRDTPTNRADRLAIQQEAYNLAEAAGLKPADLPGHWQQFATRAAGLRTFEQRAAGLTLAENEAKSLIPRVRDISHKISRTDYPTLNSLILAAQRGTGGTDVIRLGIAVGSLIPVYARVLKPVGQVTEGDTHRAQEILDKAWSAGQIDAALDQMGIELDAAKESLKNAREEFGGSRRPGAAGAGTSTAAPKSEGGASGGASGVVRWERVDGKLRPVQ